MDILQTEMLNGVADFVEEMARVTTFSSPKIECAAADLAFGPGPSVGSIPRDSQQQNDPIRRSCISFIRFRS